MIDLDQDYPKITEWFERRNSHIAPRNILPKLGIVIESNGVMAAAGWLYMDNSVGVAWPAWLSTNPSISSIISTRALSHLVTALESCAKEHDYGVFFTMASQPSMIKWLKNRGFIENHSEMVQLFKFL
jgi:hypothetical protein